MLGLNQILDQKTRNSLSRSIRGFETTVSNINKTIKSVDGLVTSSKEDLKISLENTKQITSNFVQISDTLKNININSTVKKLQTTLDNMNVLIEGVNQGNGTLGKLFKDDEMYTNLTNATKELEELLREMKLNPKRFVHFSLFGKKPKPYKPTETEENYNNKK